jgi:transcriptional regulator with PAS, ATPase and Fis domain
MIDSIRWHPTRGAELCGIRTRTRSMLRVLELIQRFAPLDTPVLIQGETGTGKELVAHALHHLSPRAAKPFVTVDCAALPETLAESELFGHERGAFTGADRPYAGRIVAAAGGTVFLDEINAVSLTMQGKLLRFLEAGELFRVGQQRPVSVNVRLVSATNLPLEGLVREGRVRADFYYRLNILRIELPPLRERRDDVPLLVEQFLEEDPAAREHGVREVAPDVLAELSARDWPGNVRELRNALRRAIVLGAEDGVLRCLEADERAPVREDPWAEPATAAGTTAGFRAWMREREREYFCELVRRYRTVSQQTAASGLPQRTLYRKIKGLSLVRVLALPDAA